MRSSRIVSNAALSVLLLALALCAACAATDDAASRATVAHATSPSPAPTAPSDPAAPRAERHAPSARDPLQSAGIPPIVMEGTITRSALAALHRAGAQRFIERVDVRPTFVDGRFFGWRVIRYSGAGPLVPGDIVTSVNGRPLERPEQAMRVWDQMVDQDQLTVALYRTGQWVELRYRILDDTADR